MVKALNKSLLIQELRERPNQSRADLSKKTKLSKPCVSELVNELIKEGIVYETGTGKSSGGRKPILLAFNPTSHFVVGAMFQNNRLFMVLADMCGNWIQEETYSFLLPAEGEDLIEMIEKGYFSLLGKQKIKCEKIVGMVLGLPGILSGMHDPLDFSPGINWRGLDLKSELERRLSKDISIENDVNMMALGECRKEKGRSLQNMVYVFVGNGIGAGLIINGHLYRGSYSAAGEIGHMVIGDLEGRHKKMGLFESNYGLMRLKERQAMLGFPYDDHTSAIEQLQRTNDRQIALYIDEVVFSWARAVINIASMIDPERIILSGELIHLNEFYYARFIEYLHEFLPHCPKIEKTNLGFKAGLYGSIQLALRLYTKRALIINE
ncbi:ROK family transcriptional regulator [Bacillus sp. 1P06AnD]|uniref:ROK family transcriptional regulator n=1 Tax=Bacillus sp. 1P06AnD TaxID=3132208 RepID=UPI00399FA31A